MARQVFVLAVLIAVVAVCPAFAAEVTPDVPSCLPAGGNGVVAATLVPEIGWSNVRVYFRAAGPGPFYFLEMRSDGAGNFWASLPKPDTGTTAVELYIVATNGDGAEVRTSATTVPVLSSCVPDLTPDQNIYAKNLVVGETAPTQAGREVQGFQCDGIVSRIGFNGNLRSDDECRREMLAAAAGQEAVKHRGKWLIPVVVLGSAGAGAGTAVALRNEEHFDCSACLP